MQGRDEVIKGMVCHVFEVFSDLPLLISETGLSRKILMGRVALLMRFVVKTERLIASYFDFNGDLVFVLDELESSSYFEIVLACV